MGGSARVRIAYLVTHPVQYQVPLLRRLSAEPGIDLTAFFCSDLSISAFDDPGFGRVITWDVPLLGGYKHQFLPALGRTSELSFWRPFNYGFARRLERGRFSFLWIHGYARWYHWVAMVVAKRLGIKVLVRDEATLISGHSSPAKRVAKRAFFQWLSFLCDGFLAIGTLNREYYLRQGIDEGKIFSVPYAVDNSFFQCGASDADQRRQQMREAMGLQPGRPVVLYVSKLMARKRPGDLLEAYARLSPDGRSEPWPYLLYVGAGEMLEAVQRRAAELGWSSIRFLGFKNQRELPSYYNLCDLFVLPSVREPWGLVVNEAMNAGRAVIVSDQVGCGPDLVRPGENGHVFRAGDVDSLHGALCNVLAEPERCRAMGGRSREIIERWGFEQDVDGLKASIAALGYKR